MRRSVCETFITNATPPVQRMTEAGGDGKVSLFRWPESKMTHRMVDVLDLISAGSQEAQ
jgi:hypothetical protein